MHNMGFLILRQIIGGSRRVISDDGTIQLVSSVQTAPDPDPSEEGEEPITVSENPTGDESEDKSPLPVFTAISDVFFAPEHFMY